MAEKLRIMQYPVKMATLILRIKGDDQDYSVVSSWAGFPDKGILAVDRSMPEGNAGLPFHIASAGTHATPHDVNLQLEDFGMMTPPPFMEIAVARLEEHWKEFPDHPSLCACIKNDPLIQSELRVLRGLDDRTVAVLRRAILGTAFDD